MMMENMLPIKVYVYENWEDYLNAKPTVNRNQVLASQRPTIKRYCGDIENFVAY